MDYLLFGGAPDTGKTGAMGRIARALNSSMWGFTIVAGFISAAPLPGNKPLDFRVVLEGKNNQGKIVRILINSATDDKYNIDELKKLYIASLPIDIIISSVRDIYWERQYFFDIMEILKKEDFYIEIPIAKITRRNDFSLALNWYEDSIDKLVTHILQRTPFNL